jgi:hypothetical protein
MAVQSGDPNMIDRRMKIALLVVSTLTIVAIVVAALQENYFAD